MTRPPLPRLLFALLLALGAATAQSPGASAQPSTPSPAPSPAQSLAQSPVPPSAAGAAVFTPRQRAAIVDIIRQALKTDPSILRDAVTAMQADDGARQAAALSREIAREQPALTRTAADPVGGNPHGRVSVVEFFDVRCPYCRRMLPVMAELLRANPDVRLVYKDIPILGPASVLGTRAEFAAQMQGGYQRMHDALMGGTANIDMAVIQAAARAAGLDWPRLQRDMNDASVTARINANLQLAQTLDVQGTPAYVIGDQMIPGAVPLADLQAAVTAAAHGG
jgi:protein-disulfide isomerase